MKNIFPDLDLSPNILKAIKEMGFEKPTVVQSKTIPYILDGRDVIVMSQTGSGKTAVFGIPILQMTKPDEPGPQGLILTPTRELAVQVDSDIKLMSKYLGHKTTAVYGQHNMGTEIKQLKKGINILTGTPGRVFDHLESRNFNTRNIRFLVLDEADRMLDMGFLPQVVRIIKKLPENRITLLFSATVPDEVKRISSQFMNNPEIIEIQSRAMTVDAIRQVYYRVDRKEKNAVLNKLLMSNRPENCMIFCNTKIAADKVNRFLTRKGYLSNVLHGDIPQSKRTKTIEKFKTGKCPFLVATDVAARGIHVDNLSLVINYDVPFENDGYVHRIGRTGRAGNEGYAISLVTSDEIMNLYEIEEHIGTMIEEKFLPLKEQSKDEISKTKEWKRKNSISIAGTKKKTSVPRPGIKKKVDKPINKKPKSDDKFKHRTTVVPKSSKSYSNENVTEPVKEREGFLKSFLSKIKLRR